MSPDFRTHPEFGYFCLSQSFRRKARNLLASTVAVGVVAGALVLWARDDQRDDALMIARVNEVPADVDMMSRVDQATAATTAQRSGPPTGVKAAACDGDNWTYIDGKCVIRRAHKPGSLASATDGPQIAAVPANPRAAVARRGSAGTQTRGRSRHGKDGRAGGGRADRAINPCAEGGAKIAAQPDLWPGAGQAEFRVTRRTGAGGPTKRSHLRVVRRSPSTDAGAEVGDEVGEAVAGMYWGRPLPRRRAAPARVLVGWHLKQTAA
jgi:hypothetical protein